MGRVSQETVRSSPFGEAVKVKTETVAAIHDRRGRHQTAATERAVQLLRKGEAADALNSVAVAKIFEAKERPRFDPLIVHLPDQQWLERVAKVDSRSRAQIEKLIVQFWPGPLTLVLNRQPIVPDIVTAGLETVAVRMSSHPVFTEVISAFGKPLAAPSANRFGRISPTTAQHVFDELSGRIPLIIDAGPTAHGIESTIIAVRDDKIDILRRGPITAEQLRGIGFQPMSNRQDADATGLLAPGQLPSHYAPKTRLRLIDNAESFASKQAKRVGLLAWNPLSRKGDLQIAPALTDRRSLKFVAVRQLSEHQDLREAAANLF
ncbi:MAG: threonylcarbamoyl-AMP synthase [Verrucomicrobia bacterium]|nr:MAG: threonylcarbamoyl-AMP synthase [Verrucomicrobiota bacterium]